MKNCYILHLLLVLASFFQWNNVRSDPLPQFLSDTPWNTPIEGAKLHANSALMIQTLENLGGFGLGRMQIDFSNHVVYASDSDPLFSLIERAGYFSPDCDDVSIHIPIPNNAAIEGYQDLNCQDSGADCHLLIYYNQKLYELYQADLIASDTITTQCLATWDLTASYPAENRGDHCTSADAAGLPMAPLLFNADEIVASLTQNPDGSGDLGHAIRFILPNNRMASDADLGGVAGRLYVRPASHAGGPSGPKDSVPYGARLRLRSDFPEAAYSPGALVILNTLKRYGMILADGGNVALTAESDLYTHNSWDDVGINSRTFDQTQGATDVTIGDFEVIDTGPRIGETYNCVRVDPITDIIFIDGFE